jgi:nucleotide-binding universal stress UspA family protein
MRIFLAVDHSERSERELANLLRQEMPAQSTVCLGMVVNPFTPPTALGVCDGQASSRWQIRLRAIQRLEELGKRLRFADLSIESELYETRLPKSMVILMEALRWRADNLIVGVHSRFGIRRRMLPAMFGAIRSRMAEHRQREHSRDPGSDRGPAQDFKKAA